MLKGKVAFKLAEIGSKSEGMYPFLELDGGDSVRIRMTDDNPFENAVLREYEGMTVEAEGEYNENNIFVAKAITKLEI